MELQFQKTVLPFLKQLASERREQEAIQEIKLSDSMPDVGRVVASWGQVLIRGKEWSSGYVSVSGAVMGFVLYAPEDGSGVRCAEGWIPFQMKWDIPETQVDGMIIVSGTVISLDARAVSSRKLLLRANVGVQLQALLGDEAEVYSPGELPEDVQVLERKYPLKVPKEAGEKAFLMDEELTMPASAPEMYKILWYGVTPELIDRKVMAGKVVFRGAAIVHVLYCTEEGRLETVDLEMPFSQYKDLEHEYEMDADAWVTLTLTSLELEQGEGDSLYLKAGMLGQYVVYDCPVISIAEDAYSTQRPTTLVTAPLELSTVLDLPVKTLRASVRMEAKGLRDVVDTACYLGLPEIERNADQGKVSLSGRFRSLYYNEEGLLEAVTERWKGEWDITTDRTSIMNPSCRITGKIRGSGRLEEIEAGGDVLACAQILGTQGIGMITGIVAEEQKYSDPNRPSLILRRMGEEDLWYMAKRCGSTVDAIRKANALDADPEVGRMLLIPIA